MSNYGQGAQYHESNSLRARGNLSYLEFIRLLEKLWTDSHPDIPMVAAGVATMPQYPCIIYKLETRRTHPNEPKTRFREEIPSFKDEDAIIIKAQRFQNIMSFAVMTENDPFSAEEIIEEFENFMHDITGIVKELGVSELVYSRRMPDSGENRSGIDVITRTVAYQITIEKLYQIETWKIRQIYIDARRWLATATPATIPDDDHSEDATPIIKITDQFSQPV